MLARIALLVLLLTLACPPGNAHAGDGLDEALDGLSGADALALVKELAADDMKGRRTGFAGGQAVENWIIAKFSEFGLHPADAGGTYLEPFTFQASRVTGPITFTMGDMAFAYGRDYYDLIQTGGGHVTAEVVFCGYGIARPDLGWDDYAGVDVKGKIVMALRGAPAARAAEMREERFIGYKTATAADQGAKGLLLVDGETPHGGTILRRFARPHMPGLWIARTVADRLLAGRKKTIEALKAARDEGTPGLSFGTGTSVTLRVDIEWKSAATGHNALGAIRGRDPDLNEEIVLVGAHMDHLGVGPNGEVFHGADDNASGTAVLVHLADRLTANRWRPKRTVVFCGFGAEEQGLLGSKALAARYPFPGRVVCVLNMDMVGQGEPIVRVNGGGAYPAMQAHFERFLPDALKTTTRFGPRTGPNADHWPFHERGVPAFFIATKGKHPNYHTPQDIAANVKAQCLEAAARTVGSLLVRLGTHPEPLADALALPNYLLREGPRFAVAGLIDGALIPMRAQGAVTDEALGSDDRARLHAAGVAGLIVYEASRGNPRRAWERLEALEKAEGSPYRLVRQAQDVGRAWREGRLALLPTIDASLWVGNDPGRLHELREIGYRIVAPFQRGMDAPPPAPALVDACREARVIVDGSGLAPKHWPAVRARLGEAPALLMTWPTVIQGKFPAADALHGATLRLVWSGRGDVPNPASALASALHATKGGSPGVLLETDADGLAEALAAWGRAQPAGWDLPGSPQRTALRAALGGRLVEWLRRTDR